MKFNQNLKSEYIFFFGGGALLMLHVARNTFNVTRNTLNGTGDPIDVSWEAIKFTYVP